MPLCREHFLNDDVGQNEKKTLTPVETRVETESGHPGHTGHILCGSTGSNLD